MNALLTCVIINNVKMAQDRIEDHARRRCSAGTVVAGTIAIDQFHTVLPGAHLELFTFCFLPNAESLLGLPWVEASFNELKANSHETSVL